MSRPFGARSVWIAVVILSASGATVARGDSGEPAGVAPRSAVRVEVVEAGVSPERRWPDPGPPSEVYDETAFGVFHVPWRYTSTGVRADRGNPFLLRATAVVDLPSGPLRILVRARSAARLTIDGERVVDLPFAKPMGDGHNPLRKLVLQLGHTRFTAPGDSEKVVEFDSPGGDRTIVLEAIVGGVDGKKLLRPETGELVVAIAPVGSDAFTLLAPARVVPLTDAGWLAYRAERAAHYDRLESQRRSLARGRFAAEIAARHRAARAWVKAHPAPAPPNVPEKHGDAFGNAIDRFLLANLSEIDAEATVAPRVDDLTFLRRVSLDVVGVPPTLDEIREFLEDGRPDRRAVWIDRLLNDPRWADVWTPRWQDWLGENPNLVNATLNNTGPFRYWLYESFRDHKPMDVFVRELVLMEGSLYGGGPAGFGLSAQNDAPHAAKAGVLASAFLAVEMKCARCHDAPYHESTQADLFRLAGLLGRGPVKVPGTSIVALDRLGAGGRKPLIRVALSPGESVEAGWPFASLVSESAAPPEADSRRRLADLITAPENERFAQVMVNRLWKHYFGRGLVEPIGDWEHSSPSHPELLTWLAREFVAGERTGDSPGGAYDLRHVARLILNSHAYQRQTSSDAASVRNFAAATRRRLSAEQVVDSLFAAFGVPLDVGSICIDLDGGRPPENGLNLGQPRRAWEFAYTSNDRDRPSLNLPRVRAVTELLGAFGWPDVRQEALSDRNAQADVSQAALLQNGVLSRWLTRLSDESAMTRLALEAKSPAALVRDIYLRVLTREPSVEELRDSAELLAPGFESRGVAVAEAPPGLPRYEPYVAWSNHLDPESTVQRQKEEAAARRGPLPTQRLDNDWRERMEDLLWSLLNAPEIVHSP